MNAVVAYLRRVRTKRGISQRAFAQAMGLSPRQVNRWETQGTEVINAEAFVRGVVFLHASFDDIVDLLTDDSATIEQAHQSADRLVDEYQRMRQTVAAFKKWRADEADIPPDALYKLVHDLADDVSELKAQVRDLQHTSRTPQDSSTTISEDARPKPMTKARQRSPTSRDRLDDTVD